MIPVDNSLTAAQGAGANGTLASQNPGASAVRVLLVEDSLPVRRRIRSLIEESGPVEIVGEASTADAALAIFREHKPDAVVLDLNLADGDGCAVLAEIKRVRPACVVIVLTNFVIAESRAACRKLGADYFFNKSREFERVPEVLKQLRGTPASVEKPAVSRPSAPLQLKPQPPSGVNSWQIVQALPAAVYTCDLQGRVTAYNEAAAKLWGCEPELGKTLWCGSWRIFEPDGRPIPLEECPMAVTIREGRPVQSRVVVIERPDGVRSHVQPHPQLLRDDSGAVVGAVNMLLDITGRHRAEAALGTSEEKFSKILHNSPNPILTTRLSDGHIIELNKAFAQFFGLTREEALGKSTEELGLWSRAADREKFVQWLNAAGRVDSFETVMRHRSGGERHVLITAELTEIGGERAILGEIMDVTRRKQAEAALRDSELRFRSIWEHSVDGMRLLDAEGNIVAVNEAYCRLVGMRRDELEGHSFFCAYLDPRPTTERQKKFRDLFARRDIPQRTERRMTFRDHRVADLEITSSFLEIQDRPPLLLGLFRDVTKRKRAEAALREAELVYHSLVENLPQNIFCKDRAGRFTFVNQRFCDTVGRPRTEVLGRTDADLFPPVLAAKYRADDERVIATRQLYTVIEEHLSPDHGRLFVEVIKTPMCDAAGNVTGIQGIFWDVTERESAAQALRETGAAFSMIFRASPVAISINTVEGGRLIEVNDRYCEFFGYQREELLGKTIPELKLWAEPEARVAAIQRVQRDGAAHDLEARYRCKSGELRDVLLSMELIDLAGETEPVLIAMFTDITERKRAEAALIEERQLLRTLVDNLPAYIFVKDTAGRYLLSNDAHTKLLGASTEAELLTKTVSDYFPPPVAEAYVRDDQELLRTGTPIIQREEACEVAGQRHWYSLTKVPFRDQRGQITGLVGIKHDITERKQAELALCESERRFRQLLHSLPAAVYACDASGLVTLYNAAAQVLWGRTPEIGQARWCGSWKRFNPDGTPQLLDESPIAVTLRTGQPVHGREIVIERPDGTRSRVIAHPVAIYDTAGTLTGGVNILVDLTERLQAEESLARERRLLRTVIDNLPGYIFAKDAAGRYTVSNQAHVRLVGAGSEAELLGKTVFDFMPPDHAQSYAADDQELLDTGRPVLDREESVEENGGRIWYKLNKIPLRDEQGRVGGLVGIKQDITAQKQAEESIRQAEAKYREIFDNAVEGIVQTDPSGRIITANPTLARLLGYATPEELLAASLNMNRDVHANPNEHTSLLRRAQTGGRDFVQCQFKRRDGQLIWVSFNVRVVRDERGEARYFEGTCVDITESRRLEEHLRQSQKMEAVGQLAGGIAHDFNNIIGAILGNVELARMIPANDPGRDDCLEAIHGASRRAADLVKQILAFSRRQEQKREPMELRMIVREVLKLLRATIPAAVVFEAELAVTPTVLADPSEIHQVAMNLCTNAWHALKGAAGVIRVTLDEIEVDAELAHLHPDLRPGAYVRLSVQDTGCGMDAATMARIFDPFFTTKPAGEGTGLGLAVVHGIVKNHDGGIVVESQPGVGTTFQLFFPVFTATPPEAVATPQELPRGNGEHILFVDDEEPLIHMGQLALERMGYKVTATINPTEALAWSRQQPDRFDLVITDFNMPGMDGAELARQLHESRPGLRLILTTGYSVTMDAAAARQSGFSELLPKPYDLQSLGEVVGRVLNQKQ